MMNDRPIENPKLQAALNKIRDIMEDYDFPGAVLLVAKEETAVSYKMDASWSALRKERAAPLGFRFRAITAETGKNEILRRVEGAVHTICQMADFGERTLIWMEQLKQMLRDGGIDFTHTPHGGEPINDIAAVPIPQDRS